MHTYIYVHLYTYTYMHTRNPTPGALTGTQTLLAANMWTHKQDI